MEKGCIITTGRAQLIYRSLVQLSVPHIGVMIEAHGPPPAVAGWVYQLAGRKHISVLHMTDPVIKIYSKLLPSIPSSAVRKYAEGMCSYHTAFKSFRDAAMSYEGLPDYQNAQQTIMEVSKDQLWPFSPHFRKCVSLTLQELFKTKIVSFGMCPVTMDQTLVFVDDHSNRWIMSLMESPHDPELNLIYMHFPRSNTPVCKCGHITQLKTLNDPALSSSGLALIVCDTACWDESLLPI